MVKKLLLLTLMGIYTARAQSPVQREYQVEAAFLYNFSQFVEWTGDGFKDEDSPFVIGIVGTDPFGHFLDEIVTGEKTKGRPIVVQRYKDIKEVHDCQILFISNDAVKDINQFHLQNTLLVSDADNFIGAGGMIRFFNANGKIRFQIDTATAKAANLIISSKLLRVASITDK